MHSQATVSSQRNAVQSVSHRRRAIRADADEVPLNHVVLRTRVEIDAVGIATDDVPRRRRCATNRIVQAPFDPDPETTGAARDSIARGVGAEEVAGDRVPIGLHQDSRSGKAIDHQPGNAGTTRPRAEDQPVR